MKYHVEDGVDALRDLIGEDKSTDSSSSKISISDDVMLHDKHDLLERPVSNPFDGEKIYELNDNEEQLNILQGIDSIYDIISIPH